MEKLRPLLSEPPSLPYAVQFTTSIQAQEYPEGTTAIHLATFNRKLNRLQKHKYEEKLFHFGQTLDLCRDHDRPLELGAPFESQTHGWACTIPDISPSVEHSSPSNDSTHSETTFVALIGWTSMEGEKVAESMKIPGTTDSLHDVYIQPMIDDADGGYEKGHLQFDFATQAHFDHWWKEPIVAERQP